MKFGNKVVRIVVEECGEEKEFEVDTTSATGIVWFGLMQAQFALDTRNRYARKISESLINDIDAYHTILAGGEELAKKFLEEKRKSARKGRKLSPTQFATSHVIQ